MSHVTTIARDTGRRTGTSLAGRIGALALAMAVGMAVGYSLDEPFDTDSPIQAMATTGLSHEEFVRINTTGLGFAPTEQAAPAATRSVETVDHFIRINTTELQPLAPRGVAPTVDRDLFDLNVATLGEEQSVALPGVEPATGGGYDLNLGSIDRDLPAYFKTAIGPR